MTTLALLTQDTINLLYGLELVERPLEDRINGAIANATTEVVAFDTPALWAADDFVEFRNGEIGRLVSTTVMKRGQRGTTATAQSDNADVTKNPPYPIVDVQWAVDQVVRNDTWPHVWTWHQASISAATLVDTNHQYPLDDWVEEVVQVYQENLDADERFRPLPPGWWDVERQVNTAVVANANLLIVHRVYDYDEPLYITGKRRPDPSTSGLTALADEIADMVPWAAAAKMLAAKSAHIKNAASRSQKDQEGALGRDYRNLISEFLRMRDQYARQLISEVREDRRWRGPQRAFHRSW